MKAAKVEHDRCNEWAGVTYVWVPDEMTEEEFESAVRQAQDDYQVFLAEWKEMDKKRIGFVGSSPRYEQFPDKTVAEVKAEWERARDQWEGQQALDRLGYRTFGNYLKPYGIIPFWDGDFAFTAHVYWGHQHGTRIEMSDKVPADLPGPRKKERL